MRHFSGIIICLATLYGIASQTIAQTVNADAVIQKTSQLYDEWGGMEVRFTAHIRHEQSGVSESAEGMIRMKKDKFVLTRPDMITWFDGTTQWTYLTQIDEVNIITPSDDDLRMLNPMILLRDYKKDFDVSYIGESTSSNAKSAYDLALVPKKKGDIEKIEMQIEKNTSLPAKLVLTMRNRMICVVTINEMKADKSPDEIFSFPKSSYPDADIIDLR